MKLATKPPHIDYLATARKAWGDDLPDWIEVLANEANRRTQRSAAGRLGYTGAVLSAVFAKKYKGNMANVEARTRGALMGLTVVCPVVGEISRDRCLDEQKMGLTGASSLRARIYRACRGGCPQSQIKTEGDDAQR